MAQPLISDREEKISYWIEKDIIDDDHHQDLLQKIDESSEKYKFSFSQGEEEDCHYFSSAWQLIDVLNSESDSIVVYSYSYLKHFIGRQVPLRKKLNWQVLPKRTLNRTESLAYNNGLSTNWKVQSERDKTKVFYTSVETDNRDLEDKFLTLSFSSNVALSTSILKELIDISEEYLKYSIKWVNDNSQVSILETNKISEFPRNGIIWIPSDSELDVKYMNSNCLLIEGAITKRTILQSNLPVVLAAHLNKVYTEISSLDFRTYNPEELKHNVTTEIAKQDIRRHPLSVGWWMLVVPIFLLERVVYHRSPQL